MIRIKDSAELTPAALSFFEEGVRVFDKKLYTTQNDEPTFSFKDEEYIQRLFLKSYGSIHSKDRAFELCVLSCIALLGVCDIRMVKDYGYILFSQSLIDEPLRAMFNDSDRIRNVLKRHVSTTGLLIKHNFLISDDNERRSYETLYLPTKQLIFYLKNIFSKDTSEEMGITMLSPQRLSGKALTNMIALKCAKKLTCYDVSYISRDFRTPAAGKMQTDGTLYIEGTSSCAYLGFVSLCFDEQTGTHIKSDVDVYVRQRVELIKQFAFYCKNKCDEAAVICVCSSKDDLTFISDELINAGEILTSRYFSLYFTNEKAFSSDFNGCEKLLVLADNDDGSYRFDTSDLILMYSGCEL